MQKAKIAAEDERSRRPKSAAPSKITIFTNAGQNYFLDLYSNQRVKTRPKIDDEPLNTSFKATKISFKMEPTPYKENEVYCKRKKFINETLELLERKNQIVLLKDIYLIDLVLDNFKSSLAPNLLLFPCKEGVLRSN